MCVQPDGVWYHGVTPANLDRVIEQHLLGERIVEDLAFHQGPGPGACAALLVGTLHASSTSSS